MKKMSITAAAAVALSGLAFTAGSAEADVVTVTSSNDTWIRDGQSYIGNGTDEVLDNRYTFVPYIQFDLSGLSIDEISNATLSVYKVASNRNDSIVGGRFGVFGLTDQEGNTAQNWDEAEDFDPSDEWNGLDFRNVGAEWTNTGDGIDRSRVFNLNPEEGADVVESFTNADELAPETITGPDLVEFLNQRADANGLVTFMIPFTDLDNPGRGYGFASKENANAALAPTLTLDFTAIPEPTSLALLGLGSLGLLRRRRA